MSLRKKNKYSLAGQMAFLLILLQPFALYGGDKSILKNPSDNRILKKISELKTIQLLDVDAGRTILLLSNSTAVTKDDDRKRGTWKVLNEQISVDLDSYHHRFPISIDGNGTLLIEYNGPGRDRIWEVNFPD